MRKRWSHRSGAAMTVSVALLFSHAPTAAAAPPAPPSAEPATPPRAPPPAPTIEDWGWGASSPAPAPPAPPPPLRDNEHRGETPAIEEPAETPDITERAETPDIAERAETPDIAERAETPDIAEPTETRATEEPPTRGSRAESDALPRPLWLAGISLSVAGGAALATGFVGLGLGAHRQKQAEDADLYGDAYDEVAAKGRRANVVAGVGLGLGAALLGTGLILLLVDGRRARKSVRAGGNVAKLRVTPRGVGISGRF